MTAVNTIDTDLDTVLIETYWNVNGSWETLKRKAGMSLNRNILECKYSLTELERMTLKCLNRNILECKFSRL